MDASKMGIILRFLGIGWYVAICIGGGTFGGYWLDRQFGLSPLFTLLGLSIGIAAAVFGMMRMVLAVLSTKDN